MNFISDFTGVGRKTEAPDRTLRFADYQALGGVASALTHRATEEYEALDEAQQGTLRRVMLRMVAIEGEGVVRRQVPKSELVYPDPAENERVQAVIQRLSKARLIVEGANSQGEPYVEPAHDALVRGWNQLLIWKKEEEENIILQRRLTPAAVEWEAVKTKVKPSAIPIQVEPIVNTLDSGLYQVENLLNQVFTRIIQSWWKLQTQRNLREQPTQFLWNSNPYLEVLNQQLKSKHHWLNYVEFEFVKQSVLQKRRNLSWRWRIAIGVILGLSALTIAALIGQRNSLIGQIQSSRESAEANFRAGQSLNAFLDALRAARTLKQPLLQLFKPDPQLEQQVQGTLQKAIYSVQERNRLSDYQGIARSNMSPDGKWVAVASEDGMVSIWNLQGQRQVQWNSGQGRIMNLGFSPNSQQIVTGGSDGTARLWNLQG